ncbi:Antimicrobial peptide 1 [Orchesella cincta]|uniref:Antimicrobial peptide 1 n=1 Tax=Orchesella cincta TaxID=48709 RepID=A0A1D2N243_ORCCI|nr:Antimicrobial peptide 1 [Orchesella cincta]
MTSARCANLNLTSPNNFNSRVIPHSGIVIRRKMAKSIFYFACVCIFLVILMAQVEAQRCRIKGEGCAVGPCGNTNPCCCTGTCHVQRGLAWGFCT